MAKEASLDDCLRLLKGDSDEQRLVGLLLATKFVNGEDIDSLRQLFDAIGFQFINRLIKTGSVQAVDTKSGQQAYLHLALSILAAFCRIPELASSDEAISTVKVLLSTLASKCDEAATGDCYECLLAVATTSGKGLQSIPVSEALPIVADHLRDSSPEAPWIPLALKFLHCLLIEIASENTIQEYARTLTLSVLPVAKQFAYRQDTVKFEALSILYSLIVSDISIPVRIALGNSAAFSEWPAHARTGVGQILHSRVAIEQKHLVLELAQSIVEIVGESWLIGPMEFPAELDQPHPGSDRFFILMVETLRVETAVLLNEVAQTMFDPTRVAQSSGSSAVKQQRLMKCFALLESVITVLANQEDGEKNVSEMISQKTVVALDEVIGIVVELLEDAQEHSLNRGDVILSCVRIVSRFLAEAPTAHRKRCLNLLPFALTVSTGSEDRPFLAVQFLLPFLTQITLDVDGCKALLACSGHKQVIEYLIWSLQNQRHETQGSFVDICDVLMNILVKKNGLPNGVHAEDFVRVLPALTDLAGRGITQMESSMAASVCVSILALTSENILRHRPELGPGDLSNVFEIIVSNIEQYMKTGKGGDLGDDEDLWEAVLSGSLAIVGRYPSFKQALNKRIPALLGARHAPSSAQDVSSNPILQRILTSLRIS